MTGRKPSYSRTRLDWCPSNVVSVSSRVEPRLAPQRSLASTMSRTSHAAHGQTAQARGQAATQVVEPSLGRDHLASAGDDDVRSGHGGRVGGSECPRSRPGRPQRRRTPHNGQPRFQIEVVNRWEVLAFCDRLADSVRTSSLVATGPRPSLVPLARVGEMTLSCRRSGPRRTAARQEHPRTRQLPATRNGPKSGPAS